VYGSYEHRRELVESVKSPLSGESADSYTQLLVRSHIFGSSPAAGLQRFTQVEASSIIGKTFEPYRMSETTARQRMIDAVYGLELERVRSMLLTLHSADAVKDISVLYFRLFARVLSKCLSSTQIECQINYTCRDVYLPAYVIEYTHACKFGAFCIIRRLCSPATCSGDAQFWSGLVL